jgi:hypothetical protein
VLLGFVTAIPNAIHHPCPPVQFGSVLVSKSQFDGDLHVLVASSYPSLKGEICRYLTNQSPVWRTTHSLRPLSSMLVPAPPSFDSAEGTKRKPVICQMTVQKACTASHRLLFSLCFCVKLLKGGLALGAPHEVATSGNGVVDVAPAVCQAGLLPHLGR